MSGCLLNTGKWRDLESKAIEFENANQLLRIANVRLKGKLETAVGDLSGDATETDAGDMQKRKRRRESEVLEKVGDTDGSD